VGSLFDGGDVPFEELPSENVDDIDAPISYLTVYLDCSIAGGRCPIKRYISMAVDYICCGGASRHGIMASSWIMM